VHAPETSDSDFSWQDFVDRNNNELVGTWGNLAHRMLTFTYKHFEAAVPHPGELTDLDKQLLATVEGAFQPVAEEIEACRFRAALSKVMAAAREANRYLDEAAPWKTLKTDRERTATACYVALRAIDSLKILFAPFVPFSSQRLHGYLGYAGNILGEQHVDSLQENSHHHLGLTFTRTWEGDRWAPSQLPPGQTLQKPQPLFKKLDDSVVADEIARLG